MINLDGKKDLLEVLRMPFNEFENIYTTRAKNIHREENNNVLNATAMLAFNNICKNQCHYCGMRAGNTNIKRFRLDAESVIQSARVAYEVGFRRIFLISGEDPKYGFDNLLLMAEKIKALGFWVSFGCGEFSNQQYLELHDAGVDEYVLKFEMAQKDTFNRLNPSTDFDKRMKCIEGIKLSGMKLASGNIVDYPGQSLEDLADDILLMKELDINWAPVVPYMPAANTPLAKEGGRGSLETNLREISILRILMTKVYITAQQPGEDITKGFTDVQGNLNALNAGANLLFADMLPDAIVQNFSVIDNRTTLDLEHIKNMANKSGMQLIL